MLLKILSKVENLKAFICLPIYHFEEFWTKVKGDTKRNLMDSIILLISRIMGSVTQLPLTLNDRGGWIRRRIAREKNVIDY